MENRLMTIVFIDMQGYTKRSASQTIEEMKLFHDQMFKFVSDTVEKGGGVMVKTMGDGFMVRFDSPTNAVQTGIEIQKRLESRNAQMMNPDSIVRFRIGINTGEVGIDENGDLFGDPVNIAARIQTFADSNDVFISETTYLAMNRNEFGSVDLGAQDLKNATREIKIYKVLKNGSPGVTVSGARKPVQPSAAGVTESHKKLIVAAVVVVLVLFTLLAGYFIGARRNRQVSPPPEPVYGYQQPVPPQGAQPEIFGDPPQNPPSSVRLPENVDTLLQLDPFSLDLKLNEHERRTIRDIQQLFNEKQLNRAEILCGEMIYRVGDMQKPVFALLLSEIFWMQNKTKDAEQIFANIRNSEIPSFGKKMCESQIMRIKGRIVR
ncbi:MAG: adenylate/guanylate cyclase domain-containing protein [Candidatus Riflebacteria bacterium]|nr:adenylate/guanylate cyclase domain-containing protein [Candidatus Riflebacteria bacterium]